MEAELEQMYLQYRRKEDARATAELKIRSKLIDQCFDELNLAVQRKQGPLMAKKEASTNALHNSVSKGAVRAQMERSLKDATDGLEAIKEAEIEFRKEIGEAPEKSLEQLQDLLRRLREFGSN